MNSLFLLWFLMYNLVNIKKYFCVNEVNNESFKKDINYFICSSFSFWNCCIIIGYSNYMGLIREESLATRMGEISKDEHFVSFENLPKNYVNAVVAVEDHRFYEHGAIDIIGIGRALYTNLKNFELQEGGSTITQQVAKNVILGQDQTLIRKISEIFAAFDLENNYSKEEIFAFYVNSAYFGDGYYGIYDASMGYYKKEPKDCNCGAHNDQDVGGMY